MELSIIVAVGKNNEIGRGNDLIWHFHEDMKFFRETTVNSSVIMGRKTFESLSKALPKRQNIVISKNRDYIAEGALVVPSVEEALSAVENDRAFVIGGGFVYKEMLDLCDKLYITEIDGTCDGAEVFFPAFDKNKYERKELAAHEEDGVKFSHVLYIKKD